MPSLLAIKKIIHSQFEQHLIGRVDSLKKIIRETKEAAVSETKSTAGDKHHVSRAMLHREIDRLTYQLEEVYKLQKALSSINSKKACTTVEMGALVMASNYNYYISAAIGKINYEGTIFFAISPVSPIGSVLLGRRSKERIYFRNMEIVISDIA